MRFFRNNDDADDDSDDSCGDTSCDDIDSKGSSNLVHCRRRSSSSSSSRSSRSSQHSHGDDGASSDEEAEEDQDEEGRGETLGVGQPEGNIAVHGDGSGSDSLRLGLVEVMLNMRVGRMLNGCVHGRCTGT